MVSTDLGTASDEDGNFSIENVEVGSELSVSAIGYETLNQFADNQEISFALVPTVIEMSSLEVLASSW